MIRREYRHGTTCLVLDRPERRNALDLRMKRALADALREARQDEQCHVVVIKGEGAHFCAGRDLRDADESMPLDAVLGYDATYTAIFEELHRMAKPSVAVVRGYAVGGGFTLAMACDFVLADETAIFGALEMRGGFPAAVNTAVLSHKTTARRSLELLLSADTVPARRLYEMGLINRLVTDAQSLALIEDHFVTALAALDPIAVQLTKETHRAVSAMPYDQALTVAKQLNALLMASGRIAEAASRRGERKKE